MPIRWPVSPARIESAPFVAPALGSRGRLIWPLQQKLFNPALKRRAPKKPVLPWVRVTSVPLAKLPLSAPQVTAPTTSLSTGRLIWPLQNKLFNPALRQPKSTKKPVLPWIHAAKAPAVVHPFIPATVPITAASPAAFAGTATLTFGQSGALNANAAAAGTTPLVFAQTGDLKANAATAGTAALTLGQTGDFKANASAASTTAITFGQSGDLQVNAAILGSTPITFGQTGQITSNAENGGTASLTLGQTGALTANGVLIGATLVTFGQSGLISAGTALGGATTLVLAPTGDFTSDNATHFVASVAITFTLTGTLIAFPDPNKPQRGERNPIKIPLQSPNYITYQRAVRIRRAS